LAIDFPAGIVAGHIEVIGGRVVQPTPPKVPKSSSSEPSFFTPLQGTYSSGESSVPFIPPPKSHDQNFVPVNHQVSIVPGASELEDKAFSPNPINVKIGDTVTWINNDDTIHVVTSGTGPSDPNLGKEFDSSPGLTTLIAPSQTFSHKFDTAGGFPYFCQLHPAMVGEIIVMSGEATTSPLTNDRNSVIPVSPRPAEEPLASEPTTDHHAHAKSKRGGGDGEKGPVGGYDTGFAVGAQQADEAVDQFDNGQLKGIDADKSPPCPAVDEGNGYCRGFHDGWRKTVIGRLD
jgi:plastocyanin